MPRVRELAAREGIASADVWARVRSGELVAYRAPRGRGQWEWRLPPRAPPNAAPSLPPPLPPPPERAAKKKRLRRPRPAGRRRGHTRRDPPERRAPRRRPPLRR